jgi:hypothetical protein
MSMAAMAEVFEILKVGRKALDYYASRLAELEKSGEGRDFLKDDLTDLSSQVAVAQEFLAEASKGDSYFASNQIKGQRDILCIAVGQYIAEMERVKTEYWNKTGVRPEHFEAAIAMARQVKADVCS